MMVNKATTSAGEDKDLSVDKLKSLSSEDQEALLSDKDDSILIALREDAIASENYEVAAIIRDTLNHKAQKEKDKKNKKMTQKIQSERETENKENQTKIEQLKKMLDNADDKFEIGNKIEYDNSKGTKITAEIVEKDIDGNLPKEGDIVLKIGNNYRHMTQSTLENNSTFKVIDQKNKLKSSLKELIEGLLQSQENLRSENSSLLEDLKDAQRKGDKKRIDNFKNLIKELEKQNKELKDKYQKEEIKYPEDEISKLSTKWINGRFISKKTIKTEEGSETIVKRPSLKINKNIRSRRKLNQVVKSFNNFQKDSDKAVKYILTQERATRLDHIVGGAQLQSAENRGRYNLLHKMGFVMSKAKFEEKFDKQQKKIIDQFKNNINPKEGSNEDKTIKALELRIKYYKQQYIKKHYGT